MLVPLKNFRLIRNTGGNKPKLSKQFQRQKKLREELNRNPQEELDELLEKVSKKGLKSLSAKEKARLDELSKRL